MDRNWLAAVLLAFAVLLAGCGGPDGGPGAENETEIVDGDDGTEIVDGETETPADAVTTGPLPRAPDVGWAPAADG